MGANTSFRNYPDSLGHDKIKELWKNDVEMSLHEDGHSYSGEIGMLGTKIASWIDLNKSQEKAYEYIETYHQKWNPALAVSFVGVKGDKYWLIGGWCSS